MAYLYGSWEERLSTALENKDFLSDSPQAYGLTVRTIAQRLGVAVSTLNTWLHEDDQRPAHLQVLQFHRWRGARRLWSEDGYRHLEEAIHRQSQSGVLARGRKQPLILSDEADQDALERVLHFRR